MSQTNDDTPWHPVEVDLDAESPHVMSVVDGRTTTEWLASTRHLSKAEADAVLDRVKALLRSGLGLSYAVRAVDACPDREETR